jgi:hypothetical protein
MKRTNVLVVTCPVGLGKNHHSTVKERQLFIALDQWPKHWVPEGILRGTRKQIMGYVTLKKIYYFVIYSD